jgi:cell division protein FtsW
VTAVSTESASAKKRPANRRSTGALHSLTTYHVLLGSTLLLLVLGLAMVLSSSTVVSYQTFGSPYTLFVRQLMYAILGVIALVIASRLPLTFFRRAAYPSLIAALGLLALVLVIGHSVAGQRNWIELGGPFRLQPSEIAKLALVLWCADLLARKQPLLDQWKHLLIPLLPVSAAVIGLILLEGDAGTVFVMVPMIAVALLVAGAPMRLFAFGGLAVGAMVVLLSVGHSYRLDRFKGWLDPEADPSFLGWQVLHGKSALGGGGWFGVGLGASREKWGWLPAANTDFIFAVVGEELGVIGSLLVIGLFAAIAVSGLRLALTARDRFVRIASAMAVAWLMTQTLLNLGAVLQLLPITGVPLPLVSYGGSSLLPTLVVLGMLLSFARHEHRGERARGAAAAVDLRTG